MAATHQINRVAALAVSLAEMLEFGQEYMAQIVANSKALGKALDERGFDPLENSDRDRDVGKLGRTPLPSGVYPTIEPPLQYYKRPLSRLA